MKWRVDQGDCRKVMAGMEAETIDAVITDPPYEIGFMGKKWDSSGISYQPAVWKEALRVLKPGGYLLAFGGTRTCHRLVCAIEDADFEIRDSIHWIYGSGFPKSRDISKEIDKAAGVERKVVGKKTGRSASLVSDIRGGKLIGCESSKLDLSEITAPATDAAKQWEGWGTALKPAHEPIAMARKPFAGQVAANVQRYGTGAINVGDCRTEAEKQTGWGGKAAGGKTWNESNMGLGKDGEARPVDGRWPPNVILSPEAAAELDVQPGADGASRFFPIFQYEPKASSAERNAGLPDGVDNNHPTVKPVALMQWLCRLVTPPGGTVLDPFAGSGTTGIAALRERFSFIGIEEAEETVELAILRINGDAPLFRGQQQW